MEERLADAGIAKMALPLYKSHKLVQALKIKDIVFDTPADAEGKQTGTAIFTPAEEGFGEITLDAAYVEKHQPKVGGYYVVYADGYKSWSPAEAFEDGYEPLDNLPSIGGRLPWRRITTEQKIERLRSFTKSNLEELLRQIERLSRSVGNLDRRFVDHEHGRDGLPVVGVERSDLMGPGPVGNMEADFFPGPGKKHDAFI